jgi:hypothetical protein
MKTDKDFELQYANVLKECIALFDEESQHEKEQISLAIKIGERVNEIVDSIEDKDAIFKRISRDIFRARGKLVTPSKIAEYRQLYLNFHLMDTVTSLEKSLMGDVSVGMLTQIALKDDNPARKTKENVSPLLTMLKKVSRLLDRFEVAIEDTEPDDRDIEKALAELEVIHSKTLTILNSLRNSGGKCQMDLFRKRRTHESVLQT